ncbi:SPOR domain-containing protein [Crenobacter cavernae]|uniref:SPOR domain-containing protein n=1 Tax=Crenobacter cavernae TaxID=2290923 RepID=A0A345Y7Y5_9NEIS|nr:SPOR domain-containing protein [Crenobacter cavernae]AXK40037.1 SPOR domain-containing protein [Crenobacter cavernae]
MAGLSSHEELIMLRKRARRRLVGAIALVLVATVVLWNVLGRVPNAPMRPEKIEISSNLAKQAVPPQAVPLPIAPEPVASMPSVAAARPAPTTELVASLPPEPSLPVAPAPLKPAEPAVAPKPAEPVVAAKPVEPVKKVEKTEKPAAKPEPKPEPKPESRPKVEAKAESKPAKPAEKPQKDPAAILEGRTEAALQASANVDKAKAEKAGAEKAGAEKAKTGNGFAIQLAALSDPEKADALRSRLAAAGVAAHFSKVTTSKGEVTRVRVGPFASREDADATLKKLARAGVTGIVVTR